MIELINTTGRKVYVRPSTVFTLTGMGSDSTRIALTSEHSFAYIDVRGEPGVIARKLGVV